MNNIDEDIKIAEHLLEYLQLKIDNGVHKIQYNELLHDEKTIDCLNAIENLLSRLKTAERMNDVFAEIINNHDIDEDVCKQMGKNFDCTLFNHDKKFCEECIKEWARKKVEDE